MYVCCITDNIVCCITDNIVCCMYFCLRPKAKDQRPRNYLSCCSSSSCWIFCLIYALSTPSTILPLLSISPSSLSLSFLSLWFLSLSLSPSPSLFLCLMTPSQLWLHTLYLLAPFVAPLSSLPLLLLSLTSIYHYFYLSIYQLILYRRKPRSRYRSCLLFESIFLKVQMSADADIWS